jgi:hypothetical protein
MTDTPFVNPSIPTPRSHAEVTRFYGGVAVR